jgi:serine/threonine-protein kinase
MAVIAELSAPDWHRLNVLLEKALALEPGLREEWLRDLPATEADLVPLLRDLLARSSEAETADHFLPEAPAERALPSLLDRPGGRVGPYRLLRELGQGGMGTVWLAERADAAIERQVALKLPHAEWADHRLADRMGRERAALAALNHPNIAHLYDAGCSESGRPFLALEYVEGVPIDVWFTQHRLGVTERVRLFLDVVRAVAQAHAQLVIHRDLKPGHVLVTADGRAKLLDFGIAKILTSEATSAAETELTRYAGRPLTLHYAAPEQVLNEPVSTSTDIYALGVMLYELLCGERPHRAAEATRRALEDAIVHVDPPPPSTVAKDRPSRRLLRGDLDTILLKALQKKPTRRYETVAAFADDLESWLEQRPVRARRDSHWYRARRFVARNRVVVGALAGIIVALAAGLSVAVWQARVAQDQAERASTINNFVLSLIQRADPLASDETRATDTAFLTAAGERIARELNGRPDLQLQMRLAIATAYRNRGEFERARKMLRLAIDEGSRELATDNLDLLRARILIAEWPLVDVGQSQAELAGAVRALRQIGKRAVPVLIDALLARRTLSAEMGDSSAAITDATEALALARQYLGPNHPTVLEAAAALSIVVRSDKGLDIIEPAYRASMARGGLSATHRAMIEARTAYGRALVAVGRPQEGLPLLTEAVELARKHHGSESYRTERALSHLAATLAYSGDIRDAVRFYREAHAMAATREPPGSLNRANLAHGLAVALYLARRPHEALSILEEAVRSTTSVPEGPLRDSRDTWQQWRFVSIYSDLGEGERAQHLAEELMSKGERNQQGKAAVARPDLAPVGMRRDQDVVRRVQARQLTLAKVVLANGDASRAEGLIRPQLAQLQPIYPNDDYSFALGLLAMSRLALNDPAEALTLADQAIDLQQRRFKRGWRPSTSDLFVTRGRALLMLGRGMEARTALEQADRFWRDFDPDNPWAAEASWWYAQSLIVTGERERGKAIMKQTRPRLAASWMPTHRALVEAH